MSYFDSLTSFQQANTAIQQHTQEIQEQGKEAKANTIEEKFNKVDALMNESGGAIGGFAGAYHIGRKVYKKVKTARKKLQEAKDTYDKLTGKDGEKPDGKSNNPDTENGGEDTEKTPNDHNRANGEEDDNFNPESQKPNVPEGEGDVELQDASEWSSRGGDASKGSGDDNTSKPDDVKQDGQDADKQPDTEAPTNESSGDALKTNVDDDDFSFFPDKEGGTDTGDIFKTKAPEPITSQDLPTGSGGASGGASGQGTLAVDDTKDISSLGDSGGLPRSDIQNLTLDPEPKPVVDDPLGANNTGKVSGNAEGDTPSSNTALADDAEQNIKSAVDTGAQNLAEKGQSLVDNVSGKVGEITDSAKGILNKGASVVDDAKTALSGASDAVDAVGGVLDFLGPIGEVIGAGLALGSFFHDLFGKHKNEEKQQQAEDAPTNIGQGGGVSLTSLATANVKSNVVGTLV